MCAIEQRTGTKIEMWREELLRCRHAPFDVGPNSVMVAYMAAAELSCFAVLGWAFTHNTLDLYVETIVTINGDDGVWLQGERRPGLQEAPQLHGLEPRMTKEDKRYWRQIILDNTNYSPEQKRGIQDYNRTDVEETLALIGPMTPAIDLSHALHRGRYMVAVARMEGTGLPVDRIRLERFVDHWDSIKRFYIERDDTLDLWDVDLSFLEWRLEALIRERGWDWPRTETGRIRMDHQTLGKQARRHPELQTTAHLRAVIAELRISALANTVGRDCRSRCSLRPFWTKTGRNQPSERDKIFLPGLPTWLHGIIAPPPGWGLVEIDYSAQEVLIMAALSGDPALLEDYHSGDPYLRFGIRAGLIPPDATSKHPLRKACKEVVLGMNYGMTAYGIMAKTGKSLAWARDVHARHRRAYHVFHEWLVNTIVTAKFQQLIESPFGWPMVVTMNTAHRALMNFPAQSSGGDMLRISTIAATEAGIAVAAPVHDAVWVMSPLKELETTTEHMCELMQRASIAVTDGHVCRTNVEHTVRYPQCLGDVRAPDARGQAMWLEVNGLIDGGQLRRVSHG
jgi:DNA polymerase I